MKCSEFEGMLDAWMDGAIDDSTRKAMQKHAETCESCREQLHAAEMLQDVLSHMDDSLTVPLKAQASWRKAVMDQARKNRIKRFSRIAGAAAAVLVLAICLPLLLKSTSGFTKVSDAYVEVDGVNEMDSLEDVALTATEPETQATAQPDALRSVMVEDLDAAYGYVMDLIEEYTATLKDETQADGERCLVITVPADNVEDFILAIDQLGTPMQDSYQNESAAETVEIQVHLIAE